MMGGSVVCCVSKIQQTVSLSSCESELMALSLNNREVQWLIVFLEELRFTRRRPAVVCEDNQGAKAIAESARATSNRPSLL